MKIKHLGLKNYRNCRELELDITSQKVLIIGKNAQGKTNILESIYLLSGLKAQRTTTTSDLINFESSFFEINSNIQKNNGRGTYDGIYKQGCSSCIVLNIGKSFFTVMARRMIFRDIIYNYKNNFLLFF